MRKIDIVMALIMALLITLIIVICASYMERKAVEIEEESIEEEIEAENPYEAELVKLAIMNSIGHINEEACFGYSFSKLVGIIYHESGGDYELSKKIATCVHNSQVKHGMKYTPIEICEMYRYTYDMGYFGSKTLGACLEVFVDCEYDEEVGNATMFYNPNMLGGFNETHEKQNYVCSYFDDKYGEIRFFEEVE